MAHGVSRRTVLAVAGLGVTSMLARCSTTVPPATSPFSLGPYQTRAVILGKDPGTTGMTQSLTQNDIPHPISDYNFDCVGGQLRPVDIPARVNAAVYYPYSERDHRVPTPNPLNVTSGPFAVLLYAHGVRDLGVACLSPLPVHEDYTRAEVVLSHVASYGCVAVAPDLSWLPPDGVVTLEQALDVRTRVLLSYYGYLVTLNETLFANQLDLNRVMFVGHSTGAGASIRAGRQLSSVISLHALAFGLLGPYYAHRATPPGIDATVKNLLIVRGTLDDVSGPDAASAFAAAGAPKTYVTVPGANHFGYTHLCELDNTCDSAVVADRPGTISRLGQQKTAAAYLSAALRYYIQHDATALPYLRGDEVVEGLDAYGVENIQVQQQGVPLPKR